MQVNTAPQTPDTSKSEPIPAELLDKDGSIIGPAKASKRIDDKALENLHSAVPIPESTKTENEESTTKDKPKSKDGMMKKILIGIGVALAALLGFKFFFGKKK